MGFHILRRFLISRMFRLLFRHLLNHTLVHRVKLQIAETSPNDIGAARRDSNFVFSPITNRLYCKPGELVPLQVVFNRQAPTDLVLNLFVVFDEQTHRTENVETCPHHRVQAEAAKLANREFESRYTNITVVF